MSEKVSKKELQQQLDALTQRIAALETQLAALIAGREIPEQHLVTIGAAVAAYFGHKAKVRAIRFSQQSRWAAASRGRVHDRSVPHVR